MSLFQDQVAADLDVFVNVDEFGKLRSLNGAPAVACVLSDASVELPAGRGRGEWEGVSEHDFTLRGKASDIPDFAIDQRITIDGKRANVTGSTELHGMRTIRARWLDS